MKIEKEILQFAPHFSPPHAALSPLQQQYAGIMVNGNSIEGTVQFFLKQGWLVSFRELFALTELLVTQSFLLNPNIKEYFQQLRPHAQTNEQLNPLPKPTFGTISQQQLQSFKSMPFFRSLEPKLAEYLLKSSSIHSVPAKTLICKSGDASRDLFILLKGQAGVYKSPAPNQRQLVATLSENSVFGEAGFLLGEKRSADIVSFAECELLRVPCQPEIFERFVDRSKAQGLQFRFWVQHALQNSPIFKNIPADCLDALSFSGRLVNLKAQHQLFAEGERGRTAYLLIQGSLVASQKGQAINVMNQGTLFGEIALILNQGTRTATVQSQQDCLLVEIKQSDFYQLLAQNLYLAKELELQAHERLIRDQQRSATKKSA